MIETTTPKGLAMMKDRRTNSNSWLGRELESEIERRAIEEERLVVEVTELLAQVLADQGRSKADLARALGTSRANITKMLNGSTNLTLRTVARLAYALGYRVDPSLSALAGEPYGEIELPPVIARRWVDSLFDTPTAEQEMIACSRDLGLAA